MTAAAPESVCAGHETGNRARVRRYRAKHTRIDYVPSPAALKAITVSLDRGLDNCMAGAIDKLILAGHQAMSGNGGRWASCSDKRTCDPSAWASTQATAATCRVHNKD